jgi:hypothetical protein
MEVTEDLHTQASYYRVPDQGAQVRVQSWLAADELHHPDPHGGRFID